MAAFKVALLCCVLSFALAVSAADTCCQCTKQCDSCSPCDDDSYNYFLFVLQWPGTYCTKSGTCCEGKTSGDDFTIHGLWPEKTKNCYPYCCGTEPFRPDEVKDFFDELKTYWPSFSCSGSDDTFHANEWRKHGTCSLDSLPDPKTGNPVGEYFQRTLELRENLPLLDILSKAGVTPSNDESYSLNTVKSAIKQATGAYPDIECTKDEINEVHFCLEKDLKTFMDCPTRVTKSNGSEDELSKKKRPSPSGPTHGNCPANVRLPLLSSNSAQAVI